MVAVLKTPLADEDEAPHTRPVQLTAWQMDDALDAEKLKLYTAEAIVGSIIDALRTRFGSDWPRDVPDYPRALRQATAMIRDAYENLEAATLENNFDAMLQRRSIEP